MWPHEPIIWTSIHLTLFKQPNNASSHVHFVWEISRRKCLHAVILTYLFTSKALSLLYPSNLTEWMCTRRRTLHLIPVSARVNIHSPMHNSVVIVSFLGLLEEMNNAVWVCLSLTINVLWHEVYPMHCARVRDSVLRPELNQFILRARFYFGGEEEIKKWGSYVLTHIRWQFSRSNTLLAIFFFKFGP